MFTFIMDFRGGTYISQIKSEELFNAIIVWGGNLELSDIKHLGLSGKREIINVLSETKPIKLEGLNNVWFLSLSIKQGFVSVNIVKTQES